MRKIVFIALAVIVISTGCGNDSGKEISDLEYLNWSIAAIKEIGRNTKDCGYASKVRSLSLYSKYGGILKDTAVRQLSELRGMNVPEKFQEESEFLILALENYRNSGETAERGTMDSIPEATAYMKMATAYLKLSTVASPQM